MEDIKIKFINKIFLVFTAILIVYTLINFKYMYDGNFTLGIATLSLFIGFIIFAITNLINQYKELGLKSFFITTIISILFYSINYISRLSVDYVISKVYLAMITNYIYVVLLSILVFLNCIEKKNLILPYTILALSFISNILNMYNLHIYDCLRIDYYHYFFTVLYIYIPTYMLFFNKEVTSSSFRNIVLIILLVAIILFIFLFVDLILPNTKLSKKKFEAMVSKVESLDTIVSDVSTSRKSITPINSKSKNKLIWYYASNNMDEMTFDTTDIAGYTYNDMSVAISTMILESQDIHDLDNGIYPTFKVGDRVFYNITTPDSTGPIASITKLDRNLYYSVFISFIENKKNKLTDDDLSNLKPFFNVEYKK